MNNADVIYAVLERRVKKLVVETKSVYEKYPSYRDGSQSTTIHFKISEYSRDIYFPSLDCGINPKAYFCFYGIIRGVE